jgi:hypothetical protein
MPVKALDLFQSYREGRLPREGGYIISSFASEVSIYTRYEVISYHAVKSLNLSDEGLTFQGEGNKLYILIEPATYPKKYIEPFRRDIGEQIPHRFIELNILTTSDQNKVMISSEPITIYGSFTVIKPDGSNFAFIFYKLPDTYEVLKTFFEKTLNQESKFHQQDAVNISDFILKGIKKFAF